MHGQKLALQTKLFEGENVLKLEPNTIKIGIMDEEKNNCKLKRMYKKCKKKLFLLILDF